MKHLIIDKIVQATFFNYVFEASKLEPPRASEGAYLGN